ncbi:phytase [Gloeocapsa sp. PCC 73106]|uniref:phytase n=1 Tax=Gloeocapsa sp. PCC 73106 TaxID=102232 RepID=UPI0002AD0EF3|nr:phytase [Gloeocapsa sp. PCC 73106]ELR98485.1 3-phytase (myo-inositol-hexaphosphate 3-phosphohydrolase) [Gloeocapsa sp. PCC 73106]
MTDRNRYNVVEIEFIGGVDFETGSEFEGTEIGGLSGISYNAILDEYYVISDDRSQNNLARYYTVEIDLNDGSLDEGDIDFTKVTTLLDAQGNPYVVDGVDPEGIAYDGSDNIYISSEGNTNNGLDPFIDGFLLTGQQVNSLAIDDKFLPNLEQTQGVRNNLAFESLAITPDRQTIYSATETALTQDGPIPTLDTESASRILSYSLTGQIPEKEYLYLTDTIPVPPNPSDAFADNGLVELIALDNQGTLLSLERSFASGVGNNIRLYQVRLQGATDIQGIDSLATPTGEIVDVDAPVQKELLLDFGDLGITLDNFEGMSLGPTLPDGRQSLIVVSDNNFNENQTTKFFAFALELESIPVIEATAETPSEIRYGGPENPDPNNIPDGDDPAIYVHPTDPNQSLVITTFKDAGLAVYDLDGQELQTISPENIRYNNVDLVYNFPLATGTVDLAIASDRRNDTLAIFAINPDTRQLTDITAAALSNPDASIFGIDDGEQTAYGLTTYTSPISNQTYVFVSQRDGNQIAQLALNATDIGTIDAEIVRTFTVPIPPEGELEDAQVEGMVADRELGYLYVGQENFGIWKFLAEPETDTTPILVDQVGDNLTPDVEGLTIYYGDSGKGYLFASSQGDSTYAIYERSGDNNYLGNFAIGNSRDIDGVEESDGADIINVSLGEAFPNGLMVVHDGSNEPAVVFPDPEDGEIQNFNTNFKYLDLADIPGLELDTNSYNPRGTSLVNGVANGDTTENSTVLWTSNTGLGNVISA